MNRSFLIAAAASVLVLLLVAIGVAVLTPAPMPHHVATVLPNDRFQPAH